MEPRRRWPPYLAPARPRNVACKTMRTALEASRPRRPPLGETEPRPRERSRPLVPPGQPPLVYGLRGAFMSTACFRAVACHVPFFRALAGFFGTGLCAAARALPPLRGRGGHAVPHNGPPAGVRAFRICAIGPLPVTDVAPLWPPPLSLRFNFREACRRCSAPAAAPRAWSRNTRPTGCSCDRG